MEHFPAFINSISLNSRAAQSEIHFESWRRQHVNYEDAYMNFLLRFHLSSFIDGAYTVVSPFTGEQVKSTFTLLSRGGGREKGARGNTSLFIMWGYQDGANNLFLVGSMDVFGWITHFIHPASQTFRIIVPTEDLDWLTPPYNLAAIKLTITQGLNANYQPDMLKESERAVLLGTSESAGHAVWNDLSGLYTYHRQASARGLTVRGYRANFSMLSESLDDEEVKCFIRLDRIERISSHIDKGPAFFPHTVFRPLDFTLSIHRVRNALASRIRRDSKCVYSKPLDDGTGPRFFLAGSSDYKDLKSITIWSNIRSPLEVKRGVCTNYQELLIDACNHLRNGHNYDIINLIIDGWTGKTKPDHYTSIVQNNHADLGLSLEQECLRYFDNVKNIIGSSLHEKLKLSTDPLADRVISLCQYGSGIIYGSVLANDMAIVMDLEPFEDIGSGNDALLGRKDIIPECKLKLVYLKCKPSRLCDFSPSSYHQNLFKIQSTHGPGCDYYEVDIKYLRKSIDTCLVSGSGVRCSFVNAVLE